MANVELERGPAEEDATTAPDTAPPLQSNHPRSRRGRGKIARLPLLTRNVVSRWVRHGYRPWLAELRRLKPQEIAPKCAPASRLSPSCYKSL